MKTIGNIPARTLKAALYCAAKNDVRYYLNGVCFEPSTGALVATDGHVLFAIKTTPIPGNEKEPAVIIPRDLVERAVAMAGSASRMDLTLEVDGHRLRFTHTSDIVEGNDVDGRFPEWRRIFRDAKREQGEPGQFQPALLMNVQRAFSTLYNGRSKIFPVVTHAGRDNAALISCPAIRDAIGLVMPFRGDAVDPTEILQSLGVIEAAKPAEEAKG